MSTASKAYKEVLRIMEEVPPMDCGNCWMDNTFHGCKLTLDECDEFTNRFNSLTNLLRWYQENYSRSWLFKKRILEYIRSLEETTND